MHVSKSVGHHEEVFADKLGCMSQFKAKLVHREGATPRFCWARPVPFSLKDANERELDSLENKGMLEKVTHADWAVPIVYSSAKERRISSPSGKAMSLLADKRVHMSGWKDSLTM